MVEHGTKKDLMHFESDPEQLEHILENVRSDVQAAIVDSRPLHALVYWFTVWSSCG